MTLTSYGDLAQSMLLRRHQAALKAEMTTLSTQVSTGQTSDAARHLGGNLTALTAIDASLAGIKAYRTVAAQAGLIAQTMQTALSTLGNLATDLGPTLLTVGTLSSAQSLETVAAEGRQAFGSAIAALNLRVADRSIFAGVETSGAALAGTDDILAALVTATAGATTAADVAAAVGAWFDDPAGYAATAYLGGTGRGAVTVAAGETVSLNTTAADPAIVGVLKGLAMAALLDLGVLAGHDDERAALATVAGEQLSEAENARAHLAARIGTVEAHIAAGSARNEAEYTTLSVARTGLISVDPYDVSARLEETETQLQLLYAVTARMTRLTLADYL